MLAATLSIARSGILRLFREYRIGLPIGHQHTFRSFIRTPSRSELDLSEGALCAGLSNRSCFFYTRIWTGCPICLLPQILCILHLHFTSARPFRRDRGAPRPLNSVHVVLASSP